MQSDSLIANDCESTGNNRNSEIKPDLSGVLMVESPSFAASMKPTQPVGSEAADPRPATWPIRLAVLFFLVIGVGFHIGMAQRGYSNYRDQHLGTALEYAKGQIDLLHPIIVGFNAGKTSTPQELPIWQALTAIFFKTFGNWFGWANVTSLLFGIAALWPVFHLARAYSGERAGWWALLFYVSQPLVFYYNGLGVTDPDPRRIAEAIRQLTSTDDKC